MPTTDICHRQSPISALRSYSPDTIVSIGSSDSESCKALFDLSSSIAGHSDPETLCNSLAASLRRVVSFDFLALVLHDAVRDQLRLHAVSAGTPYKEKQIALPVDGDHVVGARVWREQKTLGACISMHDAETRMHKHRQSGGPLKLGGTSQGAR